MLNMHAKKCLVILLAIFVFGCKQEFEDISEQARFADIVGKSFVTRKSLVLHGVALGDNSQEVIDHYSLTKEPGIDGREVIFAKIVPIGERILIKKALKCANCVLGAPIVLLVDFESDHETDDVPVYLYGLRVLSKDGAVKLAPSFFVDG